MYDNEFWQSGLAVLAIMLSIFLFIGIIVGIPWYYSSCFQAKIYNQKNNTNYTCKDFFWASEQINSQTQTIKIEK
jgi:hypothetical protein